MKVKNINSSSNKTRKSIKDSFLQLLKEETHIKNITVTAITKKANITRAAFYTHYDNIYDVVEEIQDEIMTALIKKLKELESTDELSIYVDEILNYITKEKSFFAKILQGELGLPLIKSVCNQTEKLLYTYFNNKNINNLSIKIVFFTEGSINMIVKYIKGEIITTPDNIKNFIITALKELFK